MIIIIDTREQKPLKFKNPYISDVIVEKLDVGDYGCRFKDGFSPPVVFERKSIGDLYGTFGKGYERFKRCIGRSQESGTQLFIIVEGTLSEVLKGYSRSRIQGMSIVYKAFTLWAKYGVQTVFCASRSEMSKYITHYYIGYGKEYTRRKEETDGCKTRKKRNKTEGHAVKVKEDGPEIQRIYQR